MNSDDKQTLQAAINMLNLQLREVTKAVSLLDVYTEAKAIEAFEIYHVIIKKIPGDITFFSTNPLITSQEVKDIIRNSAPTAAGLAGSAFDFISTVVELNTSLFSILSPTELIGNEAFNTKKKQLALAALSALSREYMLNLYLHTGKVESVLIKQMQDSIDMNYLMNEIVPLDAPSALIAVANFFADTVEKVIRTAVPNAPKPDKLRLPGDFFDTGMIMTMIGVGGLIYFGTKYLLKQNR